MIAAAHEMKLEERRLTVPCAQRNLAGLTEDFEGACIHKNHLSGLSHEAFVSGLSALAQTFKALYTGMANEPQAYGMKDGRDIKGLAKNTYFLLLLAQKGILEGAALEVGGESFARALKSAGVTKPELYFRIFETLGFVITGLGKKIETSGQIIVEFPDNNDLLPVLKAMADAVGMFSKANPNRGNAYFELLDCRVLENDPATEPKVTMAFILSKLSDQSRAVAEKFDTFLEAFAKREIKGGIDWYWTLTYTLRSTKKVIMSLKLDLQGHDVKLNLGNIGKYTALLEGFPEKLLSEITDGGWACGDCNEKCRRAFVFELDGKVYKKCCCGSFFFIEPDKADTEWLLELLKKELEFS